MTNAYLLVLINRMIRHSRRRLGRSRSHPNRHRVKEVTLPDGREVVEFDTAESSSTGSRPGPMDKTWRTANLTNIHPVTFPTGPDVPMNAGKHRGRIGGMFHRIES